MSDDKARPDAALPPDGEEIPAAADSAAAPAEEEEDDQTEVANQSTGDNEQLRQMMTDDPEFRKRVQSAIKEVFRQVRKAVSSDAKGALKNDPRAAYKAVRTSVYRRILGGQVNILSKRRAGQPGNYQKPLKGLPKRGGNRWGRSDRTKALEGYQGNDRGFILRFANAGVSDRRIHSYTDRGGTPHDLRSGSGNRGGYAGGNWFGPASQKELEGASDLLQELIDKVINGMFR